MKAKSLLIPIAAFALSATGVSAFNSDVLKQAGLTENQISAFEQASELRKMGDVYSARTTLLHAGITLETMESMRSAMLAHKDAVRTSIDNAVSSHDFTAFKQAVKNSPLADIVTSQEDFDVFSQAHLLHLEGKYEDAKKLMADLGYEEHEHGNVWKHTV